MLLPETISDTPGRHSGAYNEVKGVDHWRWEGKLAPVQSYLGDGCSTVSVRNQLWVIPDLGTRIVPLPDAQWYTLNRASFAEFADVFPEEISIGNFFWELREILELIPKITRSYIGMVQSGVLNVEFGWKPFLSDLKTLGGLVQKVEERVKYLRATKGRTVRIGREVDDCYTIAYSDYVYGPVRGLAFRCKHLGTRFDYRAQGYVTHDLDYLDGTVGMLRAFAGALGLNNPVKALWNSLPYSFVVDWFLDVSGHLGLVTARPVGWQLSAVCSSVKQVSRFEISQLNENLLDCSGLPPFPMGTLQYRRYTRLPGLPTGGLTVASLSPRELVLLLAMIPGTA